MKAAIYNPYLDTLGGGERYTMAIATTLLKLNYIVDVEWKDSTIQEKLEKRFGIDLENINFINDIKRGDGYDVCFWVSDGSIPTLKSRKNFLHFQVPFTNVHGKTLLNKIKLTRINKIIVNSKFTKKVIDKEFGVESAILYPPIGVDQFKPKKKENLILSVARFSQLMQSKRQDVLVKTFKNFCKSNPDYKLVLAGGVEVGADEFVVKLEKEIKGYPIEIVKSPDFKTLRELFGKAKVFWSAAGYQIDDKKEPQKVEHFGIAPVEAMSAGCIPIICNAGGHKEIIKNDVNGFLWNDTSELYRFTKKILNNEKLRKQMAVVAKEESRVFSYEEFQQKFTNFL
jgi:glycosyltransferase involved in cell wall biosynthesis